MRLFFPFDTFSPSGLFNCIARHRIDRIAYDSRSTLVASIDSIVRERRLFFFPRLNELLMSLNFNGILITFRVIRRRGEATDLDACRLIRVRDTSNTIETLAEFYFVHYCYCQAWNLENLLRICTVESHALVWTHFCSINSIKNPSVVYTLPKDAQRKSADRCTFRILERIDSY